MEYELWAGKYQQSVPRTGSDDNLNNGNSEEDGETNPKAGEDDAEGAVKVEKEQDPAPATISVSDKGKQTIQAIQEQIKTLTPIEKFLLFLKLPAEITNAVDPFRQPLNPLGSRSEIYKTISWIKTHLEEDPDISLPKQEVYTDYLNYCEGNGIKALSQADFGKVMKQVYPKVRARRLGTRGNSRYCYSGLSRCSKLKAPILPDLANKPLSTEAPFTPSNRAAAAWLIVKSWAEQQLGRDFVSIEALAAHILTNFPMASDTEAAAIIASATAESAAKGVESGNGKSNSNHREMQLQLQRKIQQKNEGKERKRKIQSPKVEPHKPLGKKTCRSQSVPAPTSSASPGQAAVSTSGECSTASSGSTSPSSMGTATAGGMGNATGTARNTICDKILSTTSSSASSLDFTILPDFNSLQRPQAQSTATAADLLLGQEGNLSSANSGQVISKVPIPRLPSTSLASRRSSAATPTTSPQKQQVKYKLVQTRAPPHQQQQPCDIVSYNPRPSTEGQNGSQLTINRISKEEEVCVDDDVDFPLTRERFDSVSNVEKDAMDEYLGTNNSQHEEELSKYFSNNNVTTTEPVDENTSKLSTLRQLLQQTVENKPIIQPLIHSQKTISDEVNFTNVDYSKTVVKSEVTYITPITNSIPLVNMNSKRRVSFETPMDEAVPPSPNTRRKNFSFTPISPGPLSPNGVQSKCSSTTASPFVSPRNTPVLRTKPMSILKTTELRKPVKIKKELSLDLTGETLVTGNQLPLADQVPMLQKLLNSNTKVCYNPAYTDCHGQEQQPFFVGDVDATSSQPVPVHELLDSVSNISFVLNPQQATTDFTIPTTTDPLCAPSLFGMNAANEYGIQLIDNNLGVQDFTTQSADENHLSHSSFGTPRIGRSQSIDMAMGFTEKLIAPSRSVPATPLPFGTGLKVSSKPDFAISKSHPSTPLTGTTFTYNFNRDCLLNGQPIHTDELDCVPVMYDNGVIEQQKDFGMVDDQFAIAGNAIEDCDLMEQNFNSNIN